MLAVTRANTFAALATSPDTNDFMPTATTGQPGFQTMKWTTVGNVSVTANNTTIVALP